MASQRYVLFYRTGAELGEEGRARGGDEHQIKGLLTAKVCDPQCHQHLQAVYPVSEWWVHAVLDCATPIAVLHRVVMRELGGPPIALAQYGKAFRYHVAGRGWGRSVGQPMVVAVVAAYLVAPRCGTCSKHQAWRPFVQGGGLRAACGRSTPSVEGQCRRCVVAGRDAV